MRRLVFLLLLAALAWPAAGAQAILGEQRVLLVLVTWGPEPWSQADARDALDGTAAYVHSASYGRTSIVGEVTPWLHALSSQPQCDLQRISDAALAAARGRGYDPSRFTTVGIAMPQIGCPWGGSYFPPGIWANGRLDRQLLAHELGHTYGVSEEGSAWVCDPRCRSVPYLNPFSVMGHGSSDYSAWEKFRYGWLDRVTEVSRAGGYRIGAIDRSSSDAGALRVLVAGDEYWVEYRPPAPVWAYSAPEASSGVAVYGGANELGEASRFPGRNLLLFDPARRGRPSLHSGETFNVAGAFSLRVGSAGPDAADVTFRWIGQGSSGQADRAAFDQARSAARRPLAAWGRAGQRPGRARGLRRRTACRPSGGRSPDRRDPGAERRPLHAPRLGRKHRVAVVAVDRAGNRSRAAVRSILGKKPFPSRV